MSIRPPSEATSKDTSTPVNLAVLEDLRSALARDHDHLATSFERLRDFVKGCDLTPARDEWDALEPAVLRHLDAEDMFLLPAFERADAIEAKAIRDEHTHIRQKLGEIGLAFDLHLVRLEEIERLGDFLNKHVARETASMYKWAAADWNHFLARSMLRRLGKPIPPGPDDAVVTTLVRLIEACRDGERGYLHAAQDVHDEGYRLIFERRVKERAAFADALGKSLRQFGVNPEMEGTLLGTVHRRWLDASATLAQGRAQTILRECERGDEAAMRVYADALHAGLPPDIQEAVQGQHDALRRGRDEVWSLLAVEKARGAR